MKSSIDPPEKIQKPLLVIQHYFFIFFDRQEAFMDNYFISQRENIFRDVEVLIYVFDVESKEEEMVKAFENYQMCLNALSENSPDAKIFCLVHKIDLIQENFRESVSFGITWIL